MAGLAIITEACIDVKDRACVDVCPVQCIYEFDPQQNVLFSEDEAGSGTIETTHAADPDAIAVFGDSILYVNLEECTSCTACYQPDVCPVGAIYSEEHLPDGSATSAKYNAEDPNKGHDHTFFVQHSRDVFADEVDPTTTHARRRVLATGECGENPRHRVPAKTRQTGLDRHRRRRSSEVFGDLRSHRAPSRRRTSTARSCARIGA